VAVADHDRRKRRWPWIALGLLVLLLAGLFAYLAMAGLLAPERVGVPKVVGRQVLQARERLERAGFVVRERRAPSQEEIGVVVDQDPNAGEKADKGSTVSLEVSQGPGEVAVPSVSNLPKARAIKQLNDAGLKVNEDPEHSDTVRKGLAIRTVPKEGEQVQRGTRVRLLVSSGPEQVPVPNLVGLSRESAEAKLGDLGLLVSIEEQNSDQTEGEVIAQDPAGGVRLDPGSRVTLTISKGPKQVEVPDVSGLDPAAATRRLRAAGLEVAQRERATVNPVDDGAVLEQRPAAGTQVDSGRTIVIIVGKLQQQEQNPETAPLSSPPPAEGTTP
jgi:beta-lactam-binding protein with PASTA domain